MIISRTPLRISFVGGGSDIQTYYNYKSGAVVSTAIDKYIYITVNKKFDDKIRASYSKTEIVDKISELNHELIRECLKIVGIKGGIEITSISDIPSEGTGLGSSSSYVVGLLNALYAYIGKYVNAERLAREACGIEIDILKKPIGKQDQYIAAYGGLQYIQFNSYGVYVDPIICKNETKLELEKRLLMFYTGLTRSANNILAVQTKNLESSEGKRKLMEKMVDLAKKTRKTLSRNSIDSFGELLHQNWILKKEMAQGVSSHEIDNWYKKAINAGATGGKILGAGGGGFLLFYAPTEKHKNIIKALSNLKPYTCRFEPQGSKIIFVN
ncbi:MAG: GHMP kinase [Candidatus Levybacteria bacterium]|nr:GHMP kinase [Candidatus Levybacteria bacterium]